MEEKGNCRKSLKKVDAASRSPEVQWQRLLVVNKVLTDYCLRSPQVFAVLKNLVIGFQNFDTFWNGIYFLTLETWNSYRVTRAELPVVPEEPLRLTTSILAYIHHHQSQCRQGPNCRWFPTGEPLRLTAYDAEVEKNQCFVIDEKSRCRFPKSMKKVDKVN